MIGQKLAHFEIQKKLGEGGMGVVYQARDTQLHRTVAIKFLGASQSAVQDRRQRFLQEARSASALNHPNIVTVYEIGEHNGADFIAMEFIDGQTLSELIPRKGMRLGDALRVAIQIADAMARAHTAGIVHRDLKPANVMVTADGRVKILDFGLAKLTESRPVTEETETAFPKTLEGVVMGTAAYMSPEQAEGKVVDARSDIFSFGAVLYEMLTGHRAFHRESRASTLSAVLNEEPEPMGERNPAVPPELERLVGRCLRKDPARRFQHMDDVKVTLEEVREDSESGKMAPPVAGRARPGSRWLLAGAMALALAGGMAYWLSRNPAGGQQEFVMTQLTRDPGLTSTPALSPDGKLLAYSSDRSGEGHFDIWVQQMAGGQPVRLTSGPGNKRSPTFSPDGTRIAFVNLGDRTLSIVPALGGDPVVLSRVLTSEPQFSPDGSQIAVGGFLSSGMETPLYLLPPTGGALRKLETGFGSVRFLAWSPDAKTILFQDWTNDSLLGEWGEIYAMPSAGGKAVSTGVVQVFRARGVDPGMVRWLNGRLLATGVSGDVSVIEEFHLQKDTWQLDGPPRRILALPGAYISLAATDSGPVVFSSISHRRDIWSIPIDPNAGKVLGAPENLTRDAAKEADPNLSVDGNRMVYVSDRTGRAEVWLRDLTTRKERQLTFTAEEIVRARISPDGTKIAYELRGKPDYILVRDIDASEPRTVCRGCSNPRWTPDSERVTYYSGSPVLYQSLNLRTGVHTDIVSHPKKPVTTMKFSPDGRWISFHLPTQGALSQIFISPVKDGRAAPETEWIPVTDGTTRDFCPAWSPDGNLLYLQHWNGTEDEIAAQPLDPITKQPKGALIHVFQPQLGQHFLAEGLMGLSVSGNRLMLAMYESKGNLWKLEPKQPGQ